MLIDMHCHTSGISHCCRAEAAVILETAKQTGIDGLILTNHYQEAYVENGDIPAFARKYVAEYELTKKIADEKGLRLFFGVEVTAKQHNNTHILLYGVTPDFVLKNPDIYERTLEEMYNMVHAEGGLVIQAHPFRSNGHILDMNFLDGIEVNCHPLYDATHRDEILEIAFENGLMATCGGDYHADTPYRPNCGVYFPENIKTEADVVEYLKSTPEIKMHVHELRTEDHADYTFKK